VQLALAKTPSAGRKPRARTTQLKLAGIATIQPDAPEHDAGKGNRPDASTANGSKPAKPAKEQKEPKEQKGAPVAARNEGKTTGDRTETAAAEPISAASSASQSRTA